MAWISNWVWLLWINTLNHFPEMVLLTIMVLWLVIRTVDHVASAVYWTVKRRA